MSANYPYRGAASIPHAQHSKELELTDLLEQYEDKMISLQKKIAKLVDKPTTEAYMYKNIAQVCDWIIAKLHQHNEPVLIEEFDNVFEEIKDTALRQMTKLEEEDTIPVLKYTKHVAVLSAAYLKARKNKYPDEWIYEQMSYEAQSHLRALEQPSNIDQIPPEQLYQLQTKLKTIEIFVAHQLEHMYYGQLIFREKA